MNENCIDPSKFLEGFQLEENKEYDLSLDELTFDSQ